MQLLRLRLAIPVLISCLVVLQPVEAQKPSAQKRAAASADVPAPQLEMTEPEIVPIPPMDPEERPPSAPRVNFHNGQLTIDANNATLRDVLVAIQKATGAVIDVPAESASERVVLHLSGVPKSVLPELLDGSTFGYVLRSSPEDPVGITELVLTRKATVSKTEVRAANGRGPLRATQASLARRTAVEPEAAPSVGSALDNTPASGSEPVPASPSVAASQSTAEAIPAMETAESNTSVQTLSAAADPHPAPPVQIADPQNLDQRQKQTETNRQFMQDLYSARQKLQSQPQ